MTDAILQPSVPLPRADRHPLDVFFAPQSVAVFGATDTPGSVGRTLMSNLIRNPFGGMLFPISPRQASVHGVPAYPMLAAVPEPVDLAIVAAPAPAVPDLLGECREAGVKAAILLSAGFGDGSEAGAEVERRVRECLRGGSMRVLGGNSVGLACPRTGLNATFAPAMVPAGKVGFLSQSGALLTALLGEEHAAAVGCSAFVSVGSLVNISWAEWLDYLAANPHTECLGVYLERLDDARSFFAAVRAVAPRKPVILLKGDGHLAGVTCDEVFEEACRCSGMLRVHKLADLFRMAALLSARPAAKGRRLAILTNARGPAVLAVDALRGSGGSLAELAPATLAELGRILAPCWNRQNPIDVGDDGGADRFGRAAAVAARDPNADALLVLLAPQAAMGPVAAATGLAEAARDTGKPVLACWMWGAADPRSLEVLRQADIPTFHSPESAVRTFGYLWQHTENMHCLADVNAALEAEQESPPVRAGGPLVEGCRSARADLEEAEVRDLFAAYGLPVRQKRVVRGEAEATEAADAIGYPVLAELTPGGGAEGEGCRLLANDAAAVRRGFGTLEFVARKHFGVDGPIAVTIRPVVTRALEMAVSSTVHLGMGPVLRLGEGGRPGQPPLRAVVALAPLTPLTAREMIQQCLRLVTHTARQPEVLADLGALADFLLRLSRLVVEQNWIKEVTVNPLLVGEDKAMAGDVRIALREEAE